MYRHMHWHCCPVVALVFIVTTSGSAGAVAHVLSSWCHCCHIPAMPWVQSHMHQHPHCPLIMVEDVVALTWCHHHLRHTCHTSLASMAQQGGRHCCYMCCNVSTGLCYGGALLSSHISQHTNWGMAVARVWCQHGTVIIVIACVITGAQMLWATQ